MTPPTSLESPASTSNRRVVAFHDLPSPGSLLSDVPMNDELEAMVEESRRKIADVIAREDDRLLVVVGPCSVHDPEAALDYARRLKKLSDSLSDDLLIVMRVYFEKPRTTVGWKGLINDPDLDSSYHITKGLTMARKLLIDILNVGLPVGAEFLEPNSPQYIADAVSWGAIGARTTESQVHRQLASGMSMPIGFKNGTDGNVQVAVDSLVSAANPHFFFGMNDDGGAAVVETAGNQNCHIILRGGTNGPNWDADSVADARQRLDKAGRPHSIMVDASHANSGKSEIRQAEVVSELASIIARGDKSITGLMMESFLVAGAQKITNGHEGLMYGQSVTDACMGWDVTEDLLHELAEAVRTRRG
ncbi:3-deoxy-7-phosphoheptulonate synthase [Corynebacterium sp. H78]|uniref:3-deoxy-7-phosphoheptulonate synthase n=1 Tax=Corynebacterium sp. H78 TaxID=3133417 RepID=UPI00309CA445